MHAELIKLTPATILVIEIKLGEMLMHWPVTIHTVYLLACFTPCSWFQSATNFLGNAQVLFRENRQWENLLKPSLFGGKKNLGLWMWVA